MNTPAENANLPTPFWPLCLLALSFLAFLGWQATTAAQQYIGLVRLADQQTVLAGQAAQAESKLQAMMMDLLELSRTDADARAIVGKYGIKFSPSPASAPSNLPLDVVLPQPKPKAAAGGLQETR
jgi:hypothetical protein